jgi:hypothetical protein
MELLTSPRIRTISKFLINPLANSDLKPAARHLDLLTSSPRISTAPRKLRRFQQEYQVKTRRLGVNLPSSSMSVLRSLLVNESAQSHLRKLAARHYREALGPSYQLSECKDSSNKVYDAFSKNIK